MYKKCDIENLLFFQVLPNGNLVLTPFRAEDYKQEVHAQTYRCIAENKLGRVVSRDVHVRAGRHRKANYNSIILGGTQFSLWKLWGFCHFIKTFQTLWYLQVQQCKGNFPTFQVLRSHNSRGNLFLLRNSKKVSLLLTLVAIMVLLLLYLLRTMCLLRTMSSSSTVKQHHILSVLKSLPCRTAVYSGVFIYLACPRVMVYYLCTSAV